jgi:hypothetical protein
MGQYLMGDFTIIGVTSDILKGLLFLNLKEPFNASFSINNISFASPKEIKEEYLASVRLSFFLYQIVENAYVKNLKTEENNYSFFALYNFFVIKCFLITNPLFSMRVT